MSSKRLASKRHKFMAIALLIVILLGIGWYANNYGASTNQNPAGTAGIATSTPVLDIIPQSVIQGEPIMIRLDGMTSTANIQSAGVAASSLSFTMYQGVPTALYGVGINQETGSTTVTVTVHNGTKNGLRLSATFLILPRVRPSEPLPVPDQIGGNSPTNQVHIADVLDIENAEIAAIPSYTKGAFWTGPFSYPLAAANGTLETGETTLKITDPYGFNRDTGETTIPHKGVDFKAASGTPVYAINDGLVRLTKKFVVYGNTVIVDHGLGIESLYMHLSRIVATPGEAVKKGQLLGYSGETGYAVGPHLHLSIKIGGVSIDPIKFFALFASSGVSISGAK